MYHLILITMRFRIQSRISYEIYPCATRKMQTRPLYFTFNLPIPVFIFNILFHWISIFSHFHNSTHNVTDHSSGKSNLPRACGLAYCKRCKIQLEFNSLKKPFPLINFNRCEKKKDQLNKRQLQFERIAKYLPKQQNAKRSSGPSKQDKTQFRIAQLRCAHTQSTVFTNALKPHQAIEGEFPGRWKMTAETAKYRRSPARRIRSPWNFQSPPNSTSIRARTYGRTRYLSLTEGWRP